MWSHMGSLSHCFAVLVQYLAAAGRPVARTAAVGDSWNDLQLLASADTAAAMENSVDGLRGSGRWSQRA